MRRAAVDALYARTPATAVLEVVCASGARRTLHLADLASGAMLAAVVARAKTAAIKDEIAGGPGGLSTARLLEAIAVEADRQRPLATARGNYYGRERPVGERARERLRAFSGTVSI